LEYGKGYEKYPSTPFDKTQGKPLGASELESYLPEKLKKRKYLK
jgi:hypothetical protein